VNPGLHFECQRFRITNYRFSSHAGEAACRIALARDRNGQLGQFPWLRHHFRLDFLAQRNRGRAFLQLGIPLGRHFIEKRCSEPSGENDRRSTDKALGIHQVIRKC